MRESLQGRRGLKAHHRSCKTHSDLLNHCATAATVGDDSIGSTDDANSPLLSAGPTLNQAPPAVKPGLKLPKTNIQWEEANAYFRSIFDMSQPIIDINSFVADSQQCIYNYFAEFWGTVKPLNVETSVFQCRYAREIR